LYELLQTTGRQIQAWGAPMSASYVELGVPAPRAE